MMATHLETLLNFLIVYSVFCEGSNDFKHVRHQCAKNPFMIVYYSRSFKFFLCMTTLGLSVVISVAEHLTFENVV